MPNRTTEISDSLIEAYQEIQEEFPEAELEIGVDIAVRDYFIEKSIDVKLDIEDVDDWREKKERVEEIARNHEDGDDIIYTFVDRKRDDD